MIEAPPRYEPTPEEIREACLEIQATWNERERLTRIVGEPKKGTHVEVQTVDSSEVDHLLTVNRDFNWSMW